MKILHIVRRYGPVGGMERYAWELTRSLALLGHTVEVLCEQSYTNEVPLGGTCHSVGTAMRRPRWLGHVIFSNRVAKWVRNSGSNDSIVHSHERCSVHQITTFHGPPFAPVRDRPIWKRMSLRIAVNLWLEKKEVSCDSVRLIVPCSKLIAEKLRVYYPDTVTKLTDPILPGVTPGTQKPWRRAQEQGGIIGFVGYEWRRKGLDIAIQIVSRLSERRPSLQFLVAGPSPESVKHLFTSYTMNYRLLGNVETSEFYPQLDLLLHPARQEPFGMVVMEAMAANVPVVISSDCGVQDEMTRQHGRVLSRDQSIEEWVAACTAMLDSDAPPPGYARSWEQVAKEYEQLYTTLLRKDAATVHA
jgi:UDP-glucose:(heptosyl)LPS alpha-1,3-glucosyltransferase